MVLDVWPVRDKKLEQEIHTDEAGEQQSLPVEAPRALAAQLTYAGFYWIIMLCRCLSMTLDGDGEGSGLGNKKLARENMAGKHSYILQVPSNCLQIWRGLRSQGRCPLCHHPGQLGQSCKLVGKHSETSVSEQSLYM